MVFTRGEGFSTLGINLFLPAESLSHHLPNFECNSRSGALTAP